MPRTCKHCGCAEEECECLDRVGSPHMRDMKELVARERDRDIQEDAMSALLWLDDYVPY